MEARAARTAVVVGAGVLGSWTARELAVRGWQVRLVEAQAPGHVRASSGGETRLIRCAHGTDRHHTDWAAAALDRWEALERETGQDLLVRSGVSWFARRDDGWEAGSARTMVAAGVPVLQLSPEEGARLFPSLRTEDLAFVLHEPSSGVLRARRGVGAVVASAAAHGAEVVFGAPGCDDGAPILDGARLQADAVVWACGPWLPELFPGLVGVAELRVTGQAVTFFGVSPAWQTPPVPGWVDYDGAAYGLGDLDGRGLKCASDVEGPALQPEQDDRIVGAEGIARARRYLSHRFPSLSDAPLIGTRLCPYTLTQDTNFVLAPLPGADGIFLVGGGSGHAFKHGPMIGAHVADLCEGVSPDPRFALGSRSVSASLRTAGGRAPPEP